MPSILILILSFDNKHIINVIVYIRFDVYAQFQKKKEKNVKGGVSLAGTGIHGYEYYDTRTRPVNMRVSKIPVPTGSGYPFLIFVFYPLWVLSAGTDIFDIPSWTRYDTSKKDEWFGHTHIRW